MDAIGEKLEHEMWAGRIPVMYNLDKHEVTSMEAPLAFCQLLPRMSYLPLWTKDVREHFRSSAPALEDELWLDYKATPLKWDLPTGVLFDLLHEEGQLPFVLTVHFLGFPSKVLLRYLFFRPHFVHYNKICGIPQMTFKFIAFLPGVRT